MRAGIGKRASAPPTSTPPPSPPTRRPASRSSTGRTGGPSGCGEALQRSRLRMRPGVGGEQAGGVDGGVALGGGERGVAEQLLDRAQVGAFAQQVGGEG